MSIGRYTQSATHCFASSSAASIGVPGSFAMPIGVALITPLAPASASRALGTATIVRSGKRAAAPRASSSARSGSLSTIRSSRVPSPSIACATADPAPPAPISATHAVEAYGNPRRNPCANPDASVLCPVARSSRNTTVLTAFIARASSDSASSSGSTVCLHGNVTFMPA